MDLVTNGVIVSDAIKFVNEKKEELDLNRKQEITYSKLRGS